MAPRSLGKPIEIAQWLRELGLEQYIDAFRDNAIDPKLLSTLTADDLKDIGVTLVGHRRRLLNAIAELDGGPSSTILGPAASQRQTPERRQLTVMFCDLVGSTALSTELDPEDLRALVSAYHQAVTQAVAAYDGFVAKYMGDGVLTYFGYPRAHEDDAERAIRAGLRAIDAVGQVDARDAKLQARVGIATGFVVVGDLIGAGSAQEQTVVGETPNLAARLQTLAAPGRLVISAATRQQIGELFDLEDLGPQRLAGFPDAQPAWTVLRERVDDVSRFEALHAETSPLVGRDEEIEVLLRRWENAKRGEGRVVLISGEPGIGKSRLTAALSEEIGMEPHARWRFFCSPHHQDSALYPFITHLERAACFVRDDGTEERLKKLRTIAAPTQTEDDIALMAELLSLPVRPAESALDPRRRREKLFKALLKQLEFEARAQPVLMIFEDAHWIDPTSREMMDLIVEGVRRLPVLLAITFRPEYQAPWGGRSHVTSMALNRLDETNGEVLVQSVAGRVGLDAEIMTTIVEHADGVPLFLEELTKTVLESAKRAATAAPSERLSGSLAVPATLHASLVARLDRLAAPSKEVAQIGAVLGREFSYSLIRPVAQYEEPTLQAALEQLSDAELLFCHGTAPHASYLFKHALVQDAAYSTLLRGKRQELHARVAMVLERDFADQVDRQPELLAYHLSAAGDTDRSIDQWLKAGRYAAARSTYREAIRHFERGLAVLATLPEGPRTDDGREIELQLALGATLFSAEGFDSARAAAAYSRARDLAERHGNSRQQFMTVYGLWQLANGGGKIHDCQSLSRRLQKLTTDNDDDELRLQAHHSGWATCLFAGEPTVALKHSEAGRHLYDMHRHRHHREIYGGHDPGMCAHYLGAHALWTLGYPDRALALGKEALAIGEQVAHPFSYGMALQYNALLHLDRCEPEPALKLLHGVEALVAEHRMGLVLDLGILRGAALLLQGAVEEAAVRLREALRDPAAAPRLRCYGLAKLGEALARQGASTAALAVAEDGLKAVQESGNRQWMAELYRLKGSALSGLGRPQESQAAFKEALRVARAQGAKTFELRAAMSLAQMWGEQGRRDEAYDLLAPTYEWFAEGYGTADLKEAKSVISQLA